VLQVADSIDVFVATEEAKAQRITADEGAPATRHRRD
jgi:hypothetical protein